MGESKIPIDTAKSPPHYSAYGLSTGDYWKATITNTDFYKTRTRDGIGKKIVVKLKSELWKKGFTVTPDKYQTLIDEYLMTQIVKYAWDNAYTFGWCLIYVGYPDVKTINDYATEANLNQTPDYFFVVPPTWVEGDIKKDHQGKDPETYTITSESGTGFKVHRTRMIRAHLNPEERSNYESAYNALDVADNILWSVGQTLWRYAQGFPVLTVKDPENVVDTDGTLKSEIQILQDDNILTNINSLAGFIGEDRYNLDFKGVEGKALKPGEYWEICLDYLAMAIDIPKDILRGISAGAVTGSEINLQDFYSTVHAKQKDEVEPIYNSMFARLKLLPPEYEWIPLFEQNEKEVAETLKLTVEAACLAKQCGAISKESVLEILKNRFPFLEKLNLQPGEEPTETGTPKFKPIDQLYNVHFDPKFIKSQYDISDAELFKQRVNMADDTSNLPKKSQRVEKQYMRDMSKLYKKSEVQVTNLMQAFNTDADPFMKEYWEE